MPANVHMETQRAIPDLGDGFTPEREDELRLFAKDIVSGSLNFAEYRRDIKVGDVAMHAFSNVHERIHETARRYSVDPRTMWFIDTSCVTLATESRHPEGPDALTHSDFIRGVADAAGAEMTQRDVDTTLFYMSAWLAHQRDLLIMDDMAGRHA